jgi:hypothetical protein
MTKIMELNTQEVIIRNLSSDQPENKIAGLQRICRDIERGFVPMYPASFSQLVVSHFFSPLAKIRRWAYYAASLLNLKVASDPLEFSLLRETDPSCRLWAWAAFQCVASAQKVTELISNPRFNYFGTPLQLIPLGSNVSVLHKNERILWDDILNQPDAAKWVPISFGYDTLRLSVDGVVPMDRSLIRDLQLHEDISVAEYAIWSFFNRRDGTSSDLAISADQIGGKAAGIRGWAYRLLFKDGPTREGIEFAIQAVTSELQAADRSARLGLARSFRNYYWSGMENLTILWAKQEADTHIYLALIEHMIYNVIDCNDYLEFIVSYYRKLDAFSSERMYIEVSVMRAGLGQGAKLYNTLNKIKSTAWERGDVVMGNKIEIRNIGSINANVVNFGTMRDAAKDSLYQVDHRHLIAPIQKELDRFIDLVEADPAVDEGLKFEAVQSIKEIAMAEPSKVQGLAVKALATIQKVSSAAKGSAEIVEAAQRIVEVLKSVF